MPKHYDNVIFPFCDMNEFFEKLGLDEQTISAIFSEETAPVIAELMNIDASLLSSVFTLLPAIIKGELSLKSLIPSLLPAVLYYFLAKRTEKSAREQSAGASDTVKKLDFDTENVFKSADEAFSPIDFYLQNSNPS